ncbi:MAG TPA: lactonase family protein [Verrucomicrobiae bacterium]|nr:lactonase family protein [Verrucomicrobiae bacterium]
MDSIRNGCFVLLALLSFASFAASAPRHEQYLLYVGTYTEDGSKSNGIYGFRYDAATAEITPLGLVAETTNPSWVTVAPNGRFAFAVNELQNYQGPNSGGLSAFSIDPATGKLTFLNEVPTRGADPCYVTVDYTGKYALVANYTGGSLAVFPIGADGRLAAATDFIQHHGHGTNPERQEGPHVHSVVLSPDNRFAYVNDLGLDEVLIYRFDGQKGTLTPNDPPFGRLDPGAGPRHFVLAPSGKFAYVINEMGRSVSVFSNDRTTGRLEPLQTVSTLPKDFSGRNDDAEIRIHPSGRFLYASNRGNDSIAVFAVDPASGKLTLVEYTSTQGKEPRGMDLDPTGKLLFAANQKSDDIVVFHIDQKTGKLTPTGKVLDVPTPVDMTFLRVR